MSAVQLWKVDPQTIPAPGPGSVMVFVDQAGVLSHKTETGEVVAGAPGAASIVEAVIKPVNVGPVAGAVGVLDGVVLVGSAFYSNYGETHAATQVQLSTSADFVNPVLASGELAQGVSVAIQYGVLAVNTEYFWRIRYKNSRGSWSAWSAGTSFKTAAEFNNFIATPAATPATFGAAFEGGFYAGLIWNQVEQSASSLALAVGNAVFQVPTNMAVTPLFYAGQMVEVRSRANPANKFAGSVLSAAGSVLVVNVTSITGAGTFSDWSIMARYRVIVAPKSSGENLSISYKNAGTSGPSGAMTWSEGKRATDALIAAGDAVMYPAAWWCHNLMIAGRSDWYMPSRAELELCGRNLKPVTTANYTQPKQYQIAIASLGAYDDGATAGGVNLNSYPQGAAYTAADPAQVAAGVNFRAGEAEAFAFGTAYYLASTDATGANCYTQYFVTAYPNYQGGVAKTGVYAVRAVRRSMV